MEWLLTHPREELRGIYHEIPASWALIDALRRRVLVTAEAERKRCADYVRRNAGGGFETISSRGLLDLADELERLAEI
jgi:hypothetical protein